MLPAVGSEVAFLDLPEERGSNGHFFQDERWFHTPETNQLMDRGELDIVQRHPAPYPDVREQISKLELRKRVGVRAIRQRHIQTILKGIQRKGPLGFAFDENHVVWLEAGVLSESGNGAIGALDRECGVMFTDVRQNDGATAAASF